jgi:hypothetical protein
VLGEEIMKSNRYVVGRISFRRTLSIYGLVGLVIANLLASPITARADEPIRVPETRLQVFVNRVHIFDDRDWLGSGEFTLHAAVIECTSPEPHLELPCTGSRVVAGRMLRFSADSGDDVRLDTLIAAPRASAADSNSSDSENLTFNVTSGKQYAVAFLALEGDGGGLEIFVDFDTFNPYLLPDFEYLGTARMLIEEGNNWRIGAQSLLGDKGAGADFFVDFEIRRPALPDLVPHHVIPRQLDDGQYVICASVLNRGESASVPFSMRYTWGQYGGDTTMSGLSPSQVGDHCFLPDATFGTSEITVRVIVNPANVFPGPRVSESDFGNNELEVTIPAFPTSPGQAQSTAATQGAVASPSSAGGRNQVDLVILSVLVKDGDADGNDCDPGKNDVTLRVKNDGAGAATSVIVRLDVGDDDTEKSVPGLDGGKEHDVKFEDIQFKKGQNRVTVTIDAKKTVTESDENNNERQLTVNCRED